MVCHKRDVFKSVNKISKMIYDRRKKHFFKFKQDKINHFFIERRPHGMKTSEARASFSNFDETKEKVITK